MKRMAAGAGLGLLLVAGLAVDAAAQVSITPQVGVYIPASDFYNLRDEAEELVEVEKEGTLGLGLAVEFGFLRGSLLYATGAQLNERGVSGRENIGDGSVLAAAADLVLRPLPRFLVQPYLLGGIGVKNAQYSTDEGVGGAFDEDNTEVAAHVGLGADLMLGGIGIMAEISDFMSRDADDDLVHDAFATVGLRFQLGGR